MKPWTEKQLNELLQQVWEEARALNIPVSKHISPSLQINNRTKTRFGGCKKVKGFVHDTYQIEISRVLLSAEAHVVKEILAHEILHTCPGCMNHGSTWKMHCRKLEAVHGYRLERTTSYAKLGITDQRKPRPKRYLIQCNQCGQQIFRQKKSPLTESTAMYRCRCGGKLACFSLKEGEVT